MFKLWKTIAFNNCINISDSSLLGYFRLGNHLA